MALYTDQIVSYLIALAPILVPAAVALCHWLLSQLPANRRAQVEQVVAFAVNAAEQLYKAQPGSGAAKKQKALEFISAELKARHISVNPSTLNMLIESFVAALPR